MCHGQVSQNIDNNWRRKRHKLGDPVFFSERVCEPAHRTRLPLRQKAAAAVTQRIHCHFAAPCMLTNVLQHADKECMLAPTVLSATVEG